MRSINFIAAMFALLVGGPVAWEFMDRTPPYVVLSGWTVPPVIHRGKEFHMEWRVRPREGAACPGTIYRFIQDSTGVTWTLVPTAAAFGLMPVKSDQLTIVGSTHTMPLEIATGPIKIYVRATYVCNFTHYIWPLTIIYDPVSSEIVE